MNEMKRTANFGDNRPIYLQISGWICEKILRGEWVADQRIPDVYKRQIYDKGLSFGKQYNLSHSYLHLA